MLWDQISHFDPEWTESADSEYSSDSLDRLRDGELELMVTPLTTFGMIKAQISREFVGAVPQIMRNIKDKLHQSHSFLSTHNSHRQSAIFFK